VEVAGNTGEWGCYETVIHRRTLAKYKQTALRANLFFNGGVKMKGARFRNAFSVFMGLFVLVLLAPTEGCTGEISSTAVCCPKITAAKVSDPWICPANCPGGGKTRVTFRIEFWKDNELCPPEKEVKISLKDLTDNVDLGTLLYQNTSTGIYEGTEDIKVTKDTDFELTVTGGGDQGCGTASGKLRVDVVDEGDFDKLCYSGPLTCTNLGSSEHTGYEPYGPGVLIDHVENLDSLKVGVRKDNNKDHLPPYYTQGTGFSGLEANGKWAIWLESETDCKIYNNRPTDAQKLCLNVYLQCKCK